MTESVLRWQSDERCCSSWFADMGASRGRFVITMIHTHLSRI